MFMTDTALISNVVVPIGSFAESEGTLTRSDRKIQKIIPAINLEKDKTVFDNLSKLGQYLDINIGNLKQATEMLSFEVPEYSGLYIADLQNADIYTPNCPSNTYGVQVLYTDGFNKECKKAILSVPEGNKMFMDKKVYDSVQIRFNAYLKENGLK